MKRGMVAYEKKIFTNDYRFLFTFFFVNIFAIMIFANEVPSSEDKEYGETKNSIDKYIDGQLDKLDINEIQDYINKEIVINDVNLKSFVKDLISGEKIS